jgi:hypothetical protein
MQTYFYSEQIRRFLIQFARMMSNFQVEYGRDENGQPTLYRVPVRYGDSSRQAQSILQNNSANSIPSTPMMTFYINALDYARDRVQEPYHVNKMHVRQRKYDPTTEEWDIKQGNAFTVERPMPVPYNLGITLDIWTSNTNQKLQLKEQLLILFNPSLEIQSTDNYIDWTSLSIVELESTQWSSRTVPAGTDDQIDIASLRFKIPIWLSPPARVKKLGVINKIIASIYDAKGDAHNALLEDDLLMGTRMQITPYGYQALLIGNTLTAYRTNAAFDHGDHSTDNTVATNSVPENWQNIVGMYGVLRDGISMITLYNDELGIQVSGTVAYHPTDATAMLFTVDEDTVPANTLMPISAIIDPLRSGPGSGLPAAAAGQRYLILDHIGGENNTEPAQVWGPVVAKANDIIEYNGSEWTVAFDSSTTAVHYVTNITTGIQYRWHEGEWLKSFEGLYRGGSWNLTL